MTHPDTLEQRIKALSNIEPHHTRQQHFRYLAHAVAHPQRVAYMHAIITCEM